MNKFKKIGFLSVFSTLSFAVKDAYNSYGRAISSQNKAIRSQNNSIDSLVGHVDKLTHSTNWAAINSPRDVYEGEYVYHPSYVRDSGYRNSRSDLANSGTAWRRIDEGIPSYNDTALWD